MGIREANRSPSHHPKANQPSPSTPPTLHTPHHAPPAPPPSLPAPRSATPHWSQPSDRPAGHAPLPSAHPPPPPASRSHQTPAGPYTTVSSSPHLSPAASKPAGHSAFQPHLNPLPSTLPTAHNRQTSPHFRVRPTPTPRWKPDPTYNDRVSPAPAPP